MATPQVPPRPIRSQNLPASSLSVDMPRIPPRPKTKRSAERSVSPNRDTFARSPLNDPKFLHNGFKPPKAAAAGESIRRPPSVTLPSIGQEGMEYANLSTEDLSPEHTKTLPGDLPLHQPKASVPPSTAKSRIQTVTRTDSSQAAAVGIGKLLAESDKGRASSAQSESSAGTNTRPHSIYKDDEEHGIPEIGVQVPMYPNAGDVQAPTPSQNSMSPATGIGFFNNVGQPSGRQHVRTKSGRQIFCGPPGSYGMHGHGVIPQHQLEKSWYDKHPEDAAREMQGEYGPAIQDNRKEWHLSKEDLNKIVHGSAGKGLGMGTSREAIGTPDEEIGYLASEEYASRLASPRPASSRPTSIHGGPPKQRSGSSQTHAESPLRKMAFPINQIDGEDGKPAVPDQALESDTSEAEDDVIHIDPPSGPPSRAQGGGYEAPLADADSEEEGAPILAADELAKNPSAEYLLPAVAPEVDRRGSGDFSNEIPAHLRKNGKNGNKGYQSAPPSLSRFSSADEQERTGTPLENVREYEPLFPEDDEEEKKRKLKGPLSKLKRPDLARHHFPSQDVWEDTPSSLQLETTVETPEPERAAQEDSVKAPENADVEDGDNTETEAEQNPSFLADEAKQRSRRHLPAHVLEDTSGRPGLAQRFPSQDIWEDAPEHVYQFTTVETPEPHEEQKAEVPAKPTVPARPQRAKPASAEAKEVSPVDKKAPLIPERPKPQVPARPSKPVKREAAEDAPLTKTVSAGSTGSLSDGTSPTAKAKPAIPARPGGSKIAALKAGFMSDLNQKLGLGPQAPKPKEAEKEAEPEVVEEKAPLSDVRKGRAKGPQRRKPAASPSPAAAAAAVPEVKSAFTLSFAPIVTVFSISDEGELDVSSSIEIPLKSEKAEVPSAEPEVSEPAASVPTATDESPQIGEHDNKIASPEGPAEEVPAEADDKAPEDDEIVDKAGVEHVSEAPPAEPVKEEPVESVPAVAAS